MSKSTLCTGVCVLSAIISLSPGRSFAQPVEVHGTRVSMSPPPGFAPAQQYPGFERADLQASIMVTELPVPAAQMVRGMTRQALASRGMKLLTASNVVIDSRPAQLLHVEQKVGATKVLKWMLIGGDEGTTLMVVGTFPPGAPALGDAIRQALLTTSSNRPGVSDPFEGLPFGVTSTGTLKLAHRVSNMLMFTESGTAGTPGSMEGLYLIGHSIGQGHIADLRSFAERRARETTHVTGVRTLTGRATVVDGLAAFELEAEATDRRTGTPMRLYQVIVPDPDGYFIAQGLVPTARAAELFPEFTAITASFRRSPRR